jgi:glucose/mannose transport system substrate-binding protein
MLVGLAFCSSAFCASLPAEQLEVLHWWTSSSERQAAEYLRTRVAEIGIAWHDQGIVGGAGMAAAKVMKTRVLAGQPPAVAQLIGETLREWAELGLVLELDEVARRGDWRQSMFPAIQAHVVQRGHVVAVPLGVHRINTLLYNRRLFAQLGLAPPHDWRSIERAAVALRRSGHVAVAWSDEPWQVATVFESMLLSEGGAALYRQLFVQRDAAAFETPAVARALERLRWWRSLGADHAAERPWTDSVRDLAQDRAGLLIMGDWAKAELSSAGLIAGEAFDCSVVPGTAGVHLYSVDTFAMLTGDYSHQPAQERMAALLFGPSIQLGYNRLKGSVPARNDIDPEGLDTCGRDSWRSFSRPEVQRVPSLTHRMVVDETLKDVIVGAVHRYAVDESQTTSATQHRLATLLRALTRKPYPPTTAP